MSIVFFFFFLRNVKRVGRVICFWQLWQGFLLSTLSQQQFPRWQRPGRDLEYLQLGKCYTEPQMTSGRSSRAWWTATSGPWLSVPFPESLTCPRTLATEKDPSYKTAINEEWKHHFGFSKLMVLANLNPTPVPVHLEDVSKPLVPKELFSHASPASLHLYYVGGHVLSTWFHTTGNRRLCPLFCVLLSQSPLWVFLLPPSLHFVSQ